MLWLEKFCRYLFENLKFPLTSYMGNEQSIHSGQRKKSRSVSTECVIGEKDDRSVVDSSKYQNDTLPSQCWECPFCTFLNDNLSGICQMCYQDATGETEQIHCVGNKTYANTGTSSSKDRSLGPLQRDDILRTKDSGIVVTKRRHEISKTTDEDMKQDQNVESEEKETSENSNINHQPLHFWQCPRCYTFFDDNPLEICKFCQNATTEREKQRNLFQNAVDSIQPNYNASMYRWNCHQCSLENIIKIQDISEVLTCSLCGHQSTFNHVMNYQIPVKEAANKSSSLDEKQKDTTSDKYEMDWLEIVNAAKHEMSQFIVSTMEEEATSEKNEMDWFKIVNAVKHEMSPFIASAMEQTLKYLNDKDGDWTPSDFSDTSIEKVITRLQQNVALKTKDVNYLQRLLKRAQFQDGWLSSHEFTS